MLVFNELAVGGAEMTAVRLVRALGRRHQFIAAAVRRGGPLKPLLIEAGAEVHDGLARRRIDPATPVRLARLIDRAAADVLIVVDVARNAMAYGLTAATLARRRPATIDWCKSVPGGQSGRFARQLRAYCAVGLVDFVVCTSRVQMRALARRGIPRSRMTVVHNGVDIRQSAGKGVGLDMDDDKKTIIQVANLMPDKDPDTLLTAARLLADRRRDFQLILVGRGTDTPEMRHRIGEAGLASVVIQAGARNDVPVLLRAAAVFVLSTRSEVFNVATLEALAAGLPVVVTDLPAFAEMFTHGREGLKVPPGDPPSLAEAMSRLLDDAELRQSMARAAEQRAGRFGVRAMADQFDRLLALMIRR